MTISAKLLIFAGIAVAMTAGEELVVYPTQDTVVLKEAESIVLTCQITGAADDYDGNLKWIDVNGQEITATNGDVYVESEEKTLKKLFISNGRVEYAGTYTCQGTVNGKTATQSKQVQFVKPIKFVDAPRNQHVTINTDDLIKCEVSGQPTPQIAWKLKGARISNDGRYRYKNNGLMISNVTLADKGEYECRATVLLTGDYLSRKIQLDVYTPPKVTQGPQEETEGTAERHFTLGCKASGYPTPKWEFFKVDGAEELPVSNTDNIKVDDVGGHIYFDPLKKKDEATYRCRASNDAGQAHAQGFLKVLVIPHLKEMVNKTAKKGSEQTLECKVEADPPAIMTFTKVGSDKAFVDGEQPDDKRIAVDVKTPNVLRLKIVDLQPEDSHNYTCRAENKAGQHAWNGTITVHYPPNFENTPVNEVFNWEGKTRNLTCKANAEPLPDWEWWHNGAKVNANDTFKIFYEGLKSSLAVTIKDVDEYWIYGDYSCNASNSEGKNHHIVKMREAKPPGAPENAQVVKGQDTPTMVVISISKPTNNGGMPVTGYRVTHNQQTIDTPVVDRVEVKDLNPSTAYFFQVYARNAVGLGASKELSHTTKDIRAPYPIVIISSPESNNPYEYTAKWDEPRTGGSDIRQYHFKYRVMQKNSNANPGSWSKKEVEDDKDRPMRSYLLNNLKPDTRYQLVILARSDMGISDPQEKNFYFFTAVGRSYTVATQIVVSRARTVTTTATNRVSKDGNVVVPPTDSPVAPSGKPRTDESVQKAGLSVGAIIGIVIALIFIFILIIDVSCYFMNDCGLLMCVCVHLCGKRPQGHEKVMEEGEGKGGEDETKAMTAEDQSLVQDDEALKPAGEKEDVKEADVAADDQAVDEKQPLTDDTKEGGEDGDDVKSPPTDGDNDADKVADPTDVDIVEKNRLADETAPAKPTAV